MRGHRDSRFYSGTKQRQAPIVARPTARIFNKIENDPLSAVQRICAFIPPMGAGKQMSAKAVRWNATAGVIGASSSPYGFRRLRREEQQAKNTRALVVLSLFVVLLAAALLMGGRSVIDPLLHGAAADRQANRVGEVFLTMPDGTFCRRLSFDNKTAEITEGAIEPCNPDRLRGRAKAKGFNWGTR